MNPDSRPPRSRLFRFFRATLLIVVALVTLGALLWAFENWRGERAWQALLKEHASKGDPLDAPATPLCRDDCAGLCPQCGADLNTGSCDCAPVAADPRWSALDQLKGILTDLDDTPDGDAHPG